MIDPSAFASLLKGGARVEDEITRALCESSLYDFLREAWPAFDPAPFVPGWHLSAICEHLQAVSDGLIKKLLINIRPRSAKTSAVSIAWPTWTWALRPDLNLPLHGPQVRFLCASYGAKKAQQDAVTARRLIGSTWYQRLWGDRVQIATDRDNQEQYDTVAGGWRISTGIPESLGKGGLIRICFPWDQVIQTELGPVPIGKIVDERMTCRVWCLDEATGTPTLSHIEGWHENPASDISKLQLDDGTSVRCTPGHVIRVSLGDWKAAADIPVGSQMQVAVLSDVPGVPRPEPAAPYRQYGGTFDTVPVSKSLSRLRALAYLARQLRRQFSTLIHSKGSMLSRVLHVIKARAVAEVAYLVVLGIPIEMANFLAFGWLPFEGERYCPMDLDIVGAPISPKRNALIAPLLFKDACDECFGQLLGHAVFPGNDTSDTDNASPRGQPIIRESWKLDPNLRRVVGVTFDSHAERTYCISVSRHHNMLVGERNAIVAKNCDDIHKTDEVESDQVRDAVLRSYREIWATRSNDPANGAEVVIMQRQHQQDISGYLLETGGPDLIHLCIPAWYESDRHCTTYVNGYRFWSDPRQIDGESFWPERFRPSQRGIDEALGPYAFAGQIMQRPEPRGGGIIKREWWQSWPPEEAIADWTDKATGLVSYPPFEFTMAYIDTSFTKKEENDYCAMSRLAVFGDAAGRPRVMLAGAWRERLNFRELIAKATDSCRRWKVEVLVIENKAGGIWVAEEIVREMRSAEWSVVLDTPTVDKVARTNTAVPYFVDKAVFAPFNYEINEWRQWAEDAIAEMEVFPKGRHDDLHDAVIGGLNYLRRNDMLKLSFEHDEDEREAKTHKGNTESIAEFYGVA